MAKMYTDEGSFSVEIRRKNAVKNVPKRRSKSIKRRNRMFVLVSKYGYTRIHVESRTAVRALSAIGKIARVWDVEILSDGVDFSVPSKVLSKIIALLDNLCYDYKIIRRGGAMLAAANAIARFGIALGIVAMIVAIAIYPCLVTDIKISLANSADGVFMDGALNARINDILASYGATEGKLLVDLDCDGVSAELLKLHGISYASVTRHGTHIRVVVKKEEPPESFVEVEGSSVKATRQAVVTRVISLGGTAAVDYGDVVKRGDVLIDGYTLYGDERIPCQARGIVYGKIYLKKSVYFPAERTVNEYGRQKKITKFGMFGKTPKSPTSPYERYELDTRVEDFGFLLPLKIYTYTFRELVYETLAEERDGEALGMAVYSQILSEIDEPARVLAQYVDIKPDQGGTYVTVTVEAEVIISS